MSVPKKEDEKQSICHHGLGLKVSDKDSMAGWAIEQINNSESFGDFVSFLQEWLTIDDIKEMMTNKVKTAQSNSKIYSMRSLFVKVAPVYDILPNDVMVKILKYLYCEKNWTFFPIISKSFKNLMYSNGSTLYNDYTITTCDDGMPFILREKNVSLKLHVSHSHHVGNIQFCPLLHDSLNKINASADSDHETLIRRHVILTNLEWKNLVKNIHYDNRVRAFDVDATGSDSEDRELEDGDTGSDYSSSDDEPLVSVKEQLKRFHRISVIGQLFLKYTGTRRRKPQDRIVKISFDSRGNARYISWGSGSRHIDFDDMLYAIRGHWTPVFLARKHQLDPDLCFSVVGREQTLDIQAQTKQMAELWVKGIRKLLGQTEQCALQLAKQSLEKTNNINNDKGKEKEKDDFLNVDNCNFPWHLIRKWEIKCHDNINGLTWKPDLKLLDNAFGDKIDTFKRELQTLESKKHVNIISIQEEKDEKTQTTKTNKPRMRPILSSTDSTDLSDSDSNEELDEKAQTRSEEAALQLQTLFRGYYQRKEYEKQIIKMKKATSIIWQSYLCWDKRHQLKTWLDDKVEQTHYNKTYPKYYSNYNHKTQIELQEKLIKREQLILLAQEKRKHEEMRQRQLEMEKEERRKRSEQSSLIGKRDERKKRLERERAVRNASQTFDRYNFTSVKNKIEKKKQRKQKKMAQRAELLQEWNDKVENWTRSRENGKHDRKDGNGVIDDFDNIVHFGEFVKKGSDRLVSMLNKACNNIFCLSLNNFPCFNYDIYNRLKQDYPSFFKVFCLRLVNIACDFDVGYGINEILLKSKINVMNLKVLELCNINCSIEYKYNKSKTFEQCLRKILAKIPEFDNKKSEYYDSIMDEFKQLYTTHIRDGSRASSKEIRKRYQPYDQHIYSYVQMNDFLEDMIESWLYYKSKLLFYQRILNTLSNIGNQNKNGLNLKVLKLDCDELNERDEILFFQMCYPQFFNLKVSDKYNASRRKKNKEADLSGLLRQFKCNFDISSHFHQLSKYLDGGNIILRIPKCDNLEILSLNNLICKVNVCNVINQASNPILIVLKNVIMHQLVNYNKDKINNNINNYNYTSLTQVTKDDLANLNTTRNQVKLSCDCLIIENNKNLPHYQAYWKQFMQSQTRSKNGNFKSGKVGNFGDSLLSPRFVHVSVVPRLTKSLVKIDTNQDVIDKFIKDKKLFESNVHFVQLNQLDNLLYRLIKYRYFVYNSDIAIDHGKSIHNNPIWLKYEKWFNMGIIEWIRDLTSVNKDVICEKRRNREKGDYFTRGNFYSTSSSDKSSDSDYTSVSTD